MSPAFVNIATPLAGSAASSLSAGVASVVRSPVAAAAARTQRRAAVSRRGIVSASAAAAPAATADLKTLIVPAGEERDAAVKEAAGIANQVTLTDVDMQWVHVLSEGWASPLSGFMREDEYVQTLHFNSIRNKTTGEPVNQSVPITLAITTEQKEAFEANPGPIALKDPTGERVVAILRNPEFYVHNKEERVARTFGMIDERHPYAETIYNSGDVLVGGDLAVLEEIIYGDGLDEYRLSPAQLKEEYARRGADAVFVFQLRNPIHNGHALLMQSCREQLIERGFKNPVLVVHQIGGKVKGDDIPLQQRIQQNIRVLEEGVLDPETTILGIFPSPMIYAGPTEVQWHAKARMNAGCQFYIVGRDPAGMAHPATGDDLYDAWHGKMALQNAPGLEKLEILPFRVAAYDQTVGKMAFFDPTRADDFLFISGTKMRKFAASGETPPDGFMAPSAWQVLVDYYKTK